MNLINKIVGLIGGRSGEATQLQAVISWLDSQGGILNVLEKFRGGGLGSLVASWISTGDNLSVSAEQISAIFGSSAVQQLADTLGVNVEGASTVIADLLPEMVNRLSPDGVLPDATNLLSAGLNLLKDKLNT